MTQQLINLSNLEVDAAGGKLNAYGTFRHPADSFSIGHADFHVRTSNLQLANFQALTQQSPGIAGSIGLTADAAADLRKQGDQTSATISNISADLSAQGLRLHNQDAGSLTATARTASNNVNYNVRSNFAGSEVKVDGRTALTKDYVTQATATIRNLSVEKVLQITGQNDIPAKGQLSADAKVSGALATPDATLDATLSKANVYQEPLNSLHAQLHYTDTLVNISALDLDVPAGTLSASGAYNHTAGDLNNGTLQFHLNSSDINLAKIHHLQQEQMGIAGTLKLAADMAAGVKEQNGKPQLVISNLNANAAATALRLNDRDLGKLTFTGRHQTVAPEL